MSSGFDNDDWMHAPGDRRGVYEIAARIGRGGYGEVYEARDEQGGRWALKLVKIKGQRDRNAVRRAVQEAKLLKSVDHINVVRYHDAFLDTDGTVGLVMEYLPGKPLRVLMNAGPMSVERALRLTRQICYAAGVVHTLGAVHRDIKPENCFILPADVLKLIDFGIAHCSGVELHTTRPIGTPLYMSPDHLSFSPRSGTKPDPRWDVYSIGIVLYELIRGRHPFEEDGGDMPTAAVVIGKHLHMEIPSLSDVIPGFPIEVARVVTRALEKEADARYPSAEAFAEALTAARQWWVANYEAEPRPLSSGELARVALPASQDQGMALRPTAPAGHGVAASEAEREHTTQPRPRGLGKQGTEPMLPLLNMRAPKFGTEPMVPRMKVVNGKIVPRDAEPAAAALAAPPTSNVYPSPTQVPLAVRSSPPTLSMPAASSGAAWKLALVTLAIVVVVLLIANRYRSTILGDVEAPHSRHLSSKFA